MTLAQAAFGPQTLTKQILMVLGGAITVALAAQVSIGWPVPVTLQTVAVLAVGLTLGARLGALSLVSYLGAGALGMPVFANAMNGAAFFGPTAGFLVGFVAMAFLAGLMTDRGLRNAFVLSLGCIVISGLLYLPGIAWAMGADAVFGLDTSRWGAGSFASIWQYYMAPFLLSDAVKAVLAALIVTGGLNVIERRSR